jgi:hypothetical protein
MGEASISPPACLSSRLIARRGVSTTANGAVTIASLEPGAASRRLDFGSTAGGGAMRAVKASDSNQPTRVCRGEGDLADTETCASVGSCADVIKLLRANANRDRTEIENMTFCLRKSYELSDMQKQLVSSILKKNERLTTQIVSLQGSEAALKALVGPGAAKGAGRSAAVKKRKRASVVRNTQAYP